jgi:transposase
MAPAPGIIDGLRAQYVLADRAYDADNLFDKILDQGGEVVIPPRRHRRFQHAYDKARTGCMNTLRRFRRPVRTFACAKYRRSHPWTGTRAP